MNFNTAPYYDDNDVDKNHMKVLFKPSYYVQARELNVLQSILQNQVSSVGNHLFKNNAKITGCSSSFVQYDYVRLNDTYNNVQIELKNYNKLRVVGVVSSVEARIVEVSEKDQFDPATLYVVYTATGSDGEQTTFIAGEDIAFYDENNVQVYTATVRCPTCPENTESDLTNPIGKSMFFSIEEGIFYHNGYFIKNLTQHIVTEKYLTRVDGQVQSELTYRVGLDVIHSVVTPEDDESLYDPHMGHPNYAAEGADRYMIELKLAIRSYVDDKEDGNFITLAKVRQNHTVEYKKDDTEYAEIMNEISRRTYETSGNFTHVPWKASFLNEKKKDPNDSLGWSTNGKDENFTTLVSVGTGYVKGHRVSNINETVVTGRKARDTKKERGASASFEPIQNFVIQSTDNLSWINHNGTSVLSNQVVNFHDAGGVSIGSFKIYDIDKVSATEYRLYIYDLNLQPNKSLSMVTSVKTADLSLQGTVSNMRLDNANSTSLLFDVGRETIKSMRSIENSTNGNTNINLKRRFTGVLDGNGSITFTTQSNEFIVDPTHTNPICWVGSNPNGVNVTLTPSKYVYSNSSLTINLTATEAGKNITLITPVLRTAQQEKTKTLTRHVFTTNSKPNSEKDSVVELNHADGYRLESVFLISTSDTSLMLDITKEYEFDNGQRDMFYESASIVRNTQRTFTNDHRLIITYYYFEHSGNQGYFTVDSYAQLINDVELDLEYSDIPIYRQKDGTEIRLAEVYDFRTIRKKDGTLENNTPIVQFNTNASFDIEFYIPRSDLLLVGANGNFYYKEGVPSETPSLPTPDPDSMPIYEVYIPAYTYHINDIRVRFIDNRKYTMKDISKFEKRIGNVENAIALSMLEMQTVNMSIKDQNGLDRYKNGFLVDNFKTFYGSDINNIEYRASLDRSMGQLRPEFKSSNIRLAIDKTKSENLVHFGNIAMMQFQDDCFISNPFTTKSLSINPYMLFRKMGNMTLSPNIDTWADNRNLPTIVANIDTGVEALRSVADAARVTGIDYGTWIDFNQSITTASSTDVVTTAQNRTTTTTNVTTSTVESVRNVQTKSINSRTQSYTIDDIVKDVSIIPYIRSTTIQFYATDLKANTKMYAFFDGIDVTEHCKKTQQLSTSGDVLVNRAQAVFGASPLITDEDGNLSGEFRIPANTFFTGEKKFVLTNDSTNSGNSDVETSRAESTYFAGGVSTVKQDATMNVITPTYNVTNTSENRTTTSVSRNVTTSVETFPPPAPPVVSTPSSPPVVTTPSRPPMPPRKPGFSSIWHWVWQGGRWVWDPVAQGFKVDQPCFISKVDVFFASVDEHADSIWFEIREMVNGYPSDTGISRVEKNGSQLKDYVSDDGSKAYTVTFPAPVYVEPSKSYAFVVGGYSPETRLWVSTLGEKLLNSETILEQPPLTYTMFRSLNGETWTAYQYDTMKLNIYRCMFNGNDAKFAFKNVHNVVDDEYTFTINCDDNPIEVQVSSNKVRVHAKNHGLKDGDYVTMNFDNKNYYLLEVVAGMPQIDQPISTTTGSGYIRDIQITETLNFYRVSVRDMEGYFLDGQEFTCESREYQYRDLFLVNSTGAFGSPITQNLASGFVRDVRQEGVPTTISGAPISLFAKKHIVREVDSIDSFIIEIESTFQYSGRYGGGNVTIFNTNVKYDIFNVSGQFLTYDSDVVWKVSAHKYDEMGFENDIIIKPQNDIHLNAPLVVYSAANEKRIFNNANSSFNMMVDCIMSSPYVSPVFNTDSFSMTTISNRIDNINVNKNSIEPNPTAQVVDETHPIGGTEKFKHISHKVMLENPATDMKLLFDVFCPSEGDFDVYVKVITAQNNVEESKINWHKVDDYTKKRYSNGLTDLIEYNLQLSEHCSTWTEDIEYIGYRVKLVGKSTNSSKLVFFENLRAIAIT